MSGVRRRVEASRFVMPAVAVVAIFGAYGGTRVSGDWVSSGRGTVTGGRIEPADLRGWMTLQQSADGLGLDVPTLLRLAGADAGAVAGIVPGTSLSALEGSIPGFSLPGLRSAVTAYLDHGDADAPAPSTAPSPSAVPTSGASTAPRPSGGSSGGGTGTGTGSAAEITGQMTLAQVALAYHVPLPELIARSGLPADVATDVPLRTLKDAVPGFEISAVRAAVGAS